MLGRRMGEIRQPGYRPTGENRSAARGEAGEVPELPEAAQLGLAWLAVRGDAVFGFGQPCGGARKPPSIQCNPMKTARFSSTPASAQAPACISQPRCAAAHFGAWRAAMPSRAAQVVLFLPAALSCAAAHAQLAPGNAPLLPPVVVSATGYPQPLSTALPSVSVITREQIEDYAAQNLTTLLQQVAGVQVTSNGGPGQSGNVYVRGFSGPDVLVLLDGVPLNAQDSTGVAYLNNLTTDQIQRIEIIRGNVSAIYGSGAIGGVVLITTREGSRKPQGSVSVTVGSRDTTTTSADASGQIGKTALQAGVSRYTSQGIPSQNPSQSGLPNQADGYRNTTAHGSVVQEWAAGQRMGLRAFSSEGRYTYDNTENAGQVRQELGQLFSDNQINPNWLSHLDLSQQTTTNANAGSFTSDYRTRVDQLSWRNVVQLGKGWTATGGLQVQHQGITGRYDYGYGYAGSLDRTRTAKALFAGLNGSFDGNALQFNVRHDSIEGYSGQNTGYLGYGRELGGGFKAIASYSTAFNAPPLGYLYDIGNGGNPDLRPEKAHSAEGGLQWSRGPNVWRATLFQTQATDQWQYLGGAFQNVARSRTRGLELTGRGSWNNWAYDANLTLQQPVDLTKPGHPTLQRRARSLANVAINHAMGSLLLGAAVHYSGPRMDKNYGAYPATDAVLGSYTTVDLTVSGAITAQWSWNARVQNLFDKKYQMVYGYNREPFGVFVGLTWHPLGL